MQMTFTKLPKSITAEELLSTPLPPVKWIVPGLLPAGLALFAGPSKAGKSWLTLCCVCRSRRVILSGIEK